MILCVLLIPCFLSELPMLEYILRYWNPTTGQLRGLGESWSTRTFTSVLTLAPLGPLILKPYLKQSDRDIYYNGSEKLMITFIAYFICDYFW